MENEKDLTKRIPTSQSGKGSKNILHRKQRRQVGGGESEDFTKMALSSLGNSSIQRMLEGSFIQPKLEVSSPGDRYEQQADRIAEQVVGGGQPNAGAVKIDKVQAKGGTGGTVPKETEAGIKGLKGKGMAIEKPLREFFEPRMGVDLSNVRVHTGSQANKLAGTLNARAFTHGNDIVFKDGEYKPGTNEGKKLLAHELVHTVQQGGGVKREVVQRTTHGPETPTNAHNWKIPLPPWIAGTIAHGQISTMLGIAPNTIPRATKIAMGMPNPPSFTPHGFADLWKHQGMSVGIAEIKSTSTGSAIAQSEAAHYVNRHNEWATRIPSTDIQDITYLAKVGSYLPGTLLDLSPLTGVDRNLGPFWGDPLKQLHIEADNLGAVVYWCTGQGLQTSPLWLPIFKEIVNELKNWMNEAKKIIDDIVVGVNSVIESIGDFIQSVVDWGMENSRVLAFIFLVVLLIVAIVCLIISVLAEPASGGSSTAGVVASAAALCLIVVGLGDLIGLNGSSFSEATITLAKTVAPEEGDRTVSGFEYDNRSSDNLPSSKAEAESMVNSFDPMTNFLASAGSFINPVNLAQKAFSNINSISSSGTDKLNEGTAKLAAAGDSATASYINSIIKHYNLT